VREVLIADAANLQHFTHGLSQRLP
jgi:hypothetical protein